MCQSGIIAAMPLMPPFLVTDVEVSTAVGLAGIVVASSTAVVLKLIDASQKSEQRHAETYQALAVGINAAVEALRDARLALSERR